MGFLDYLQGLKFTCDIDAVPEGTLIFPYEPLLRVKGPIVQAQILESVALNILNFQTLIATKASRIVAAAEGNTVVEFGMRRAQGIDGAISASRAAYIGGCHSTSHVLAGKLFNIPLQGTQAHSWIMAFEEERSAFKAFAKAFPHHSVFLIDTYEALQGIKNAIQVADSLKKEGFHLLGVRLDSGDLARLSIEVRELLDQAGYVKTAIMASNELDEHLIQDLKKQKATITIWGVGTHLVTAKDQPALDGVYKLTAIKKEGKPWEDKIKISEQKEKTTLPGLLQVRRFLHHDGSFLMDAIYDEKQVSFQGTVSVFNEDERRKIEKNYQYKDLLIPIFRKGKLVYTLPPLVKIRKKCQEDLALLPSSMRRLLNPELYFIGLENDLFHKRLQLLQKRSK